MTTRRFEVVSDVGARRQARLVDARLAVVVDGRRAEGDLADVLAACCRGSADVLVLCDKTATEDELRTAAVTFRAVADEYGALFVVNDLPGLAREVGADAVHVGQTDVHPDHARRVAGADILIGRTVQTPEQLAAAADEDVDYLVVGPVRDADDGPRGVGTAIVTAAARSASYPWFAAGGITPDEAGDVLAAGARRLSVGRCVVTADDPEATLWALRGVLARAD